MNFLRIVLLWDQTKEMEDDREAVQEFIDANQLWIGSTGGPLVSVDVVETEEVPD